MGIYMQQDFHWDFQIFTIPQGIKKTILDYGLGNQAVHCVCVCMCIGTEILATDPEKEPTTNLSLQLLNYLSVDTY